MPCQYMGGIGILHVVCLCPPYIGMAWYLVKHQKLYLTFTFFFVFVSLHLDVDYNGNNNT